MKKILIFHPVIAPYRIDFFNELYKAFDTTICLLRKQLNTQKFDTDKLTSQFEFEPEYLTEKNILGGTKGIFRKLREVDPDVVLVSECGYISIMVVLYKILFFKSYKIVSVIDDSYDIVSEKINFSWKHSLCEKLLLPFFTDVINVEPRVVDFFQNKYGKGVYFPIIKDEEKCRKRYEKILPISQQYVDDFNLKGKKVVLFVGRLVKIKNPQSVIKAFLNRKYENAVFVIVGSGDYEDELKYLAKDSESIIFTGRLEGEFLEAWYNVADVFILPSTVEPFGAVTNEALLGGCFSIISSSAGSQCLIRDGINGFIVDPHNQENIEECIFKTLSSVIPNTSHELSLRKNLMLEDFRKNMERLVSILSQY